MNMSEMSNEEGDRKRQRERESQKKMWKGQINVKRGRRKEGVGHQIKIARSFNSIDYVKYGNDVNVKSLQAVR